MLDHALDYAARGWPVFPQAGKCPMIKGGGGVHGATLDEAQIREWWHRWPHANIGLACGVAGWWALDVDAGKGRSTLMRLTKKYRRLPKTVCSLTGGGGWHFLFTCPPGLEFRNWSGGQCSGWPHLGVDIRAHGAAITAPPSIHPHTHRPYRWADCRGPGTTIAETPGWLVDLVTPPPLAPAAPRREPVDGGDWGPHQRWSEEAMKRALARLEEAACGSRPQEATLNAECYMIGQLIGAGHIRLDYARPRLINAGLRMMNLKIAEPWKQDKIIKKVEDAIAAGIRRPRDPRK